MSTEAMKRWLKTLEYASTGNRRPELIAPAIAEISQAIAEAEQTWPVAFEKTVCPFCSSSFVTAEQHDRNVDKVEQTQPVAWMYWQSCLNDDGTQTAPWVHRLSKFKPMESIINKDIEPLYTHPPRCLNCASLEAQNAELDAKLAELEQSTEQEPVAWIHPKFKDQVSHVKWANYCEPLYTHPQEATRKPLTRRQIREIEVDVALNPSFDYITPAEQLCRAIEAAHGIGEKE